MKTLSLHIAKHVPKAKTGNKLIKLFTPALLSLSIASTMSMPVSAGSKVVDFDNSPNSSWRKAGLSLKDIKKWGKGKKSGQGLVAPGSDTQQSYKNEIYTSERSQIPIDDENDTYPLGAPYDSVNEVFISRTSTYVTPVDDESTEVDQNGDGFYDSTTFTGNTEGYFTVGVDQDHRSILDSLSGGASADLQFASVNVDGNISLAIDSAADEFTKTYTLFARVKPKKAALIPLEPTSNSIGAGEGLYPTAGFDYRAGQGLTGKNLMVYTGDEYVHAVELGAWAMVVMKFKFRNAEDKKDIGGRLAVDWAAGTVTVDGQVNYSSVNNSDTVEVEIRGYQYGGDDTNILQVIPADGRVCNFQLPQDCFDDFAEGVDYLRDEMQGVKGFSAQFTDASGNLLYNKFNPVRYFTERYDESGPKFTPYMTEPLDQLTFASRQALREIYSRWEIASMHERRANYLKTSRSTELSSAQLSTVTDIEVRAGNNKNDLAGKISSCLAGTPGQCATLWADKSFLQSYDETALEF